MERVSDLVIREIEDPAGLREVADFFVLVWGRAEEGVPMSSEVLRSLVHAGGMVSMTRDDEIMVGAAVLGRGLPGECYSYLAAVRPGRADLGVGRALKAHQRRWALDHGLSRMVWTFDPLVSRNARFNLVKLGALTAEYEVGFYGQMNDEQNRGDVGDRLVVHWELDSPRVREALDGCRLETTETTEPRETPEPRGQVLALGPDGEPQAWREGDERWLRVPTDIVALRTHDPAQAAAWRACVREAFLDAFAGGWVADGLTRSGCYHLAAPAG